MLYLIKFHWGWLFGALVLGGAVGWTTWQRVRERWMDRAVWTLTAVVAVAVLVAFLKLLPGRPGYWLDLALLMIGAYAVGCVFGWLLRDLSDVPALAEVGWPAAQPVPDHMLRPPYLSKPGQIPWSVVVAGPDAVAAWTAERAGTSGAAAAAVEGPAVPVAPMPAPSSSPARQPERADVGSAAPSSSGPAATGPTPVAALSTGDPGRAAVAATSPAAASSGATAPEAAPSVASVVAPSSSPASHVPDAAAASAATLSSRPAETGPEMRPGVASSSGQPAPATVVANPPAAVSSAAPAAEAAPSVAAVPTASPAVTPPPAGATVDDVSRPQPAPTPAADATATAPSARPETSGEIRSVAADSSTAVVASSQAARPAQTDLPLFGQPSSSGGAPGATGGPSAGALGAVAPAVVAPAAPATPSATGPSATAAPAADVPEPPPAPPVPDQDKHGGTRPAGLVTARGGTADDLKRIKGIGPQNEVRLHDLGIWHFAQIASWTPDNVHWVGSYLAFPGRIDRERWIEQAVGLAAGGASAKDVPRTPRPRR